MSGPEKLRRPPVDNASGPQVKKPPAETIPGGRIEKNNHSALSRSPARDAGGSRHRAPSRSARHVARFGEMTLGSHACRRPARHRAAALT
ncbi:hypothetical protein Sme01_30180 [Sphaerisporangium melleum]|uniref:Uncharacterized protein n=1 Tax=Sphaerisporangium melleum TaxID=321316 RepID=A0A917RS57_9ACTN|nr:hypothetical protein GCM10007964_75180 [Sphaerisporangium melleum]GII70542.1 hypothetical protein Sme01_30180 [Sphaerisporangium melleum]